MIEDGITDVVERARRYNFWSWSAQAEVDPLHVVNAEGVYFWDATGKRYLDFNSMRMCVNIGHRDPRVIDAIVQQVRELPYASPSMATRPQARLGELLAEITPSDLSRFFYTTSGGEANENAVKLARAYTGRHKILTRYRSYHGATHGAIALTGDPRRWAWEPNVMPGVVHFLDPYRYRSTFHRTNPDIPDDEFAQDYLNHLEEIITLEGPRSIAGILIEPVTGTNGIIIPPDRYLPGVREICDRYGILLIADEVMSGFGRTGAWFAVDHWDVVPDLITMAKGLTSAYAPLGAVGMRPEIAAYFDHRVYQGGLTYNSHPVSLAAASAVISVMQADDLVGRAHTMGAVLARHLSEMAADHPSVGEVRSIGLFGALELVRNRRTRAPMADFNSTSPEMAAFQKSMLDQGVFIFTHWNVVLVVPPLIIDEAQLAEGFAAIDRALEITDAAVEA